MQKIIFLVVIIMVFISPSQALEKIYINDTTYFDLGNGANITLLPNQTFDDHIDLQPGGSPILHLILNGSEMNFTSISDKTISNFTYNYSADKLEFDVIGIADELGMLTKMRRNNTWYNESDALVVIAENKSDENKLVGFIFNNWTINQHHITIEVNSSSIFSISGFIKNKLNLTVAGANVTLIGDGSLLSGANGFYILENIASGNYTIKVILYPYSNKSVPVTINNTDLTNFNITLNSQSGGTTYKSDYSPIYILVFMITSIILFVRKRRGRKDENDK